MSAFRRQTTYLEQSFFGFYAVVYNDLYDEVINISDGDDDDFNVHVDHTDDDGVEIVQKVM